jgi:CheY-like chemotaxis protein/anti-sigma regulatory factor (Ser/Thr protein kinase)
MKSEFVSTVSHELRTPLPSITGALGLIVGGALGEVPRKAAEMLGIAHANGQRLTALINDLLDMEKISSGKLHFDMRVQLLSPIVEQAIEANRSYGFARGVSIALVDAPANGTVEVDSLRLTQVLSNLLSNAIKFSPDGGVVEVAVEHRGPSLSVSVRDRGPGIPTAFRDRVFQKFAQADASDTRARGGTGLGLAITRDLVERMSGHIGFESVEGAGATFTFELPNFDLHPAAVDDAPRVLVVEDEAEVAGHLVQLLATAGYAADVAATGAAAFELLSRTGYVAMTLDLVLPDIGGVEVIRRVRGCPATSELTIIVVSAAIQEGQAALADDALRVGWMAKPLVGNELIAQLEGRLRGSTDQRRSAS